VAKLEVRFKDFPGARPPDPTCSGTRCSLTKGAQGAAHGRFCYDIVVKRTDGSTARVDPKLIILP
jgi:hypothetical protein